MVMQQPGSNVLFVTGEINEEVYLYVSAAIHEARTTGMKELWLQINSGGGSLGESFAIVNMMEWAGLNGITVNTLGIGMVASGGLLVFMAGKRRVLAKKTYVMTHQLSTESAGSYSELKSNEKYHDSMNADMVDHFKKYSYIKNKEEITAMFLPPQSTWLTLDECLNLGICDYVGVRHFKNTSTKRSRA